MPNSATFSHLDLAHVAGAVALQLQQESEVSSFESLDPTGWGAHQRALERGVVILEVCMGALALDAAVKGALERSIARAESSIELLTQWLAKAA